MVCVKDKQLNYNQCDAHCICTTLDYGLGLQSSLLHVKQGAMKHFYIKKPQTCRMKFLFSFPLSSSTIIYVNPALNSGWIR